MLARPYYAPNYAGIIRPSLPRRTLRLHEKVHAAFAQIAPGGKIFRAILYKYRYNMGQGYDDESMTSFHSTVFGEWARDILWHHYRVQTPEGISSTNCKTVLPLSREL